MLHQDFNAASWFGPVHVLGKSFDAFGNVGHLLPYLPGLTRQVYHSPNERVIMVTGFPFVKGLGSWSADDIIIKPECRVEEVTSIATGVKITYDTDFDYIPYMDLTIQDPGITIQDYYPTASARRIEIPGGTPVIMVRPSAEEGVLASYNAAAELVSFTAPYLGEEPKIYLDGVLSSGTWSGLNWFFSADTAPRKLEYQVKRNEVSRTVTIPVYPIQRDDDYSYHLFLDNPYLLSARLPALSTHYSSPPRLVDAAFARLDGKLVVLVSNTCSSLPVSIRIVKRDGSTATAMVTLSAEGTSQHILSGSYTPPEDAERLYVSFADGAPINPRPGESGYWPPAKASGWIRVRKAYGLSTIIDTLQFRYTAYSADHIVLPNSFWGLGVGGPLLYPTFNTATIPKAPYYSFMTGRVMLNFPLGSDQGSNGAVLVWSDRTTTEINRNSWVDVDTRERVLLGSVMSFYYLNSPNQVSVIVSRTDIDGYLKYKDTQFNWPAYREFTSGYRQIGTA